MGFLRVTRCNGGLVFEFPGSEPGAVGRGFLEQLADHMKKILDQPRAVPAPRS
jgi:hypothetical protein